MVFDKEWFVKHQRVLLFLANTKVGKFILRINGNRSSVGNNEIIRIDPNAIHWKEGKKIVSEFRTHNKFAKRLYYSFKPLWYLIHGWDLLTKPVPSLNLGFDTLTAFPVAGINQPADGRAYRGPVTETFANIRAGAGSTASATDANESYVYLQNDGTSGGFQFLVRSIFLFDASAIPVGNDIETAVLSLFGSSKANGLGAAEIDIVSSNPDSLATVVTADYQHLGSTPFASITYGSYSTSAYNDFNLNPSGIANVSKGSGVSKFGARINWDTDGTFGGSLANAASNFNGYYADQTGTSNDPKLVVTHGAGGNAVILI